MTLTLGSGSNRKPSATVTIIAIMAEIRPAICICKRKNKKLMFHLKATSGRKSVNQADFTMNLMGEKQQ